VPRPGGAAKKKFNFKFTSKAVQEQLAAPGGGRRLPAAATGPRRRALPVQCRGAAKKKIQLQVLKSRCAGTA